MDRYRQTRLSRRLPGVAPSVLAIALLSGAGESRAQVRAAAPGAADNPAASTPSAPSFQASAASSAIRRTLRQYDALVADGVWDEAIDAIESLQANRGDEAVESSILGPNQAPFERFVTVGEFCQSTLAGLPPEGLKVYRRRVDATARRWLREGVARVDEDLLRRVAEEFFASSSGDDALVALGDLALQRGDTAAARRWLRRVSPLLWGPLGEPIHAALLRVPSETDPDNLAAAWRSAARPNDLFVCPDTSVPIGDLLARLIVASLRDGDAARAGRELMLLDALEPQAEGRLAGRVQPFAPGLRRLIETAARRRPASLGPLRKWLWSSPVQAAAAAETVQQLQARRRAQQRVLAQRRALANRPELLARINLYSIPEPPRPKPAEISTSDRWIVFVDQRGLRKIDTATGEAATISLPGDPEPVPAGGIAQQQALGARVVVRGVQIQNGRVQWFGNNAARGAPASSVSRGSVALHGDTVFAVVSQPLMRRAVNGRVTRVALDKLLGLDLSREDKLVVEITGDEIQEGRSLRFTGPPTVAGERIYCVLNETGVGASLSLACFSSRGGRPLWRVELGAGQPIGVAGGRRAVVAVAPPVVRGDTVYVATDLGAVVAIDARRGKLRWQSQYERLPAGAVKTPPSPCVAEGDRLYVAPRDSPHLLALDATDGRVLWLADSPDDESTIVGVAGDTLVVAGRRVFGYGAADGRRRVAWPESDHAGIRGMGRGVLVGDTFCWPTRDQIFFLDPSNGGFSRPPMGLDPVSLEGANLAVVGGGIAVAGSERIGLLGDRTPASAELPSGVARLWKVTNDPAEAGLGIARK